MTNQHTELDPITGIMPDMCGVAWGCPVILCRFIVTNLVAGHFHL